MRRRVLDWYHFYLNHPGGSRPAKTTREVCYWKNIFTQAEMYDNPCKICQRFKKRNTLYGLLPPKNIAELKTWDTVHVDLLGLYSKSYRQQQPVGAIIKNDISLTCMKMIDLAKGCFEIPKVLTYDLDEVTGGNDKYIDKSYARAIQLFNNTCLRRYPCQHKVVFDNGFMF